MSCGQFEELSGCSYKTIRLLTHTCIRTRPCGHSRITELGESFGLGDVKVALRKTYESLLFARTTFRRTCVVWIVKPQGWTRSHDTGNSHVYWRGWRPRGRSVASTVNLLSGNSSVTSYGHRGE